jgi:folate-binding protein YgfZ
MNAPLIAPVSDTRLAEEIAAHCNGSVFNDDFGPQCIPHAAASSPHSLREGWVAPVTDLGILRAEGADALRFLHSQFTNDLENLPSAAWHLTGYCSAKGRLLSTLIAWREPDAVMLIAPQPLVAGLKKRLSMFVLRAKVQITDDSESWTLLGVGGARAAQAVSMMGLSWPAPGTIAQSEARHILGFAAIPAADLGDSFRPAEIDRALMVLPRSQAGQAWRTLSAQLVPAPSTIWRWTDVRAGVPRIAAAGVEHFVPQMVNLDLVNGVSFRKGCYPGQEVVARSHYLGKLKRRMFLAHVEGNAPEAGLDVTASGATEACGEVVMSAPAPGGGAHVLFESQIAAAERASLPDGRTLALVELPYPVGS